VTVHKRKGPRLCPGPSSSGQASPQWPTGLADGLRLGELPLLVSQDAPHWEVGSPVPDTGARYRSSAFGNDSTLGYPTGAKLSRANGARKREEGSGNGS
jgi:hypothetical protein